uniref:Reverse transcriptase domain-containing protein n=1 Tax=Sphaeramia orbicularis TaxID=375764 RepID=A0A672ZFB6_9TELE
NDNKLKLPTLPTEDTEHLERPISQAEILAAINSMASGKAPGDDEFSIHFYKTVSSLLVDKLQRVFKEARDSGHLPDSMHTSLITVLLKSDKDPLQCEGYPPISLLNSDIKIYAKILERRLDEILPKLIHIDQIGFVRSRKIAENMRKLFHIIHYASLKDEPSTAVSLDVAKAFDCIE